ncbi:A-kinase anchor protein 14-like [Anoplophora glabripennis]|uniref:A-kinase anchor protein 14-like n=1 Tax=Anoplophora glabripennis TaxID=217634 RepID=UPI000C755DA9|nr:A-kinase anchor protein 14-like [Anoplophora glabripennis]
MHRGASRGKDRVRLVQESELQVSSLLEFDKVSDFYFYEAKFCIPTFCYPIAQATVGVYFTIEVSRVVPEHLPVRVTFKLESLRRVLVPGEILVDDEMLLRVLYSKLAVFKELCF